jgi:hypothetical protein
MRQGLVTFLAALLGVLVAQFAFHFYAKHEAGQARAAADAEHEARLEQGRQLAEQTLAEEHAAQAIREALAVASSAKNAIAEYYMANGQMPASNVEVGLAEADAYRGISLQSLAVGEGGRIAMTFDAYSGAAGGVIELIPDLSGIEAMGMQWHCRTQDFPQIKRAWPGPGCEYVPKDGAAVSTEP